MAWTRITVNQPPSGENPMGSFVGEVGKTYEVRVRTLRENADPSAWSAIVERLATIANPAVPMNIALTYDTDTTTITATWDAVPLATSYEVAWGPAATVSATTETVAAAASNTFSVSTVTANTRYGFRVRALRTGATTSEYSKFSATEDYHEITTLAGAIPTLSAPTATPSTTVNARIDLSWTRAAIAASYDLEWRTGSGAWTTVSVAQPASGNVSYAFVGTADTAYEFRVRARVTTVDVGDYSPTATATAPSIGVMLPPAIRRFSVAARGGLSSGVDQIEWQREPTATYYELLAERESTTNITCLLYTSPSPRD